jgi:hypothetical protein
MAQPITREAFVEMLHDYVRDALQQRLQDKHSSHFALCAPPSGAAEMQRASLTHAFRPCGCRLLTSFDRLPTLPAHEAKVRRPRQRRHRPALTRLSGGRPPSRRSRSTCRWSTTWRTSSCC